MAINRYGGGAETILFGRGPFRPFAARATELARLLLNVVELAEKRFTGLFYGTPRARFRAARYFRVAHRNARSLNCPHIFAIIVVTSSAAVRIT